MRTIVRFIKARSKSLKGRPEWQDIRPPTKEHRDAYAIAARHVDRFARAFTRSSRAIITDDIARKMRAAIRDGDAAGAVDALPAFIEGADDNADVWEAFQRSLDAAYADVIKESGAAEFRRINKDFRSNLRFSLEPMAKQRVPVVPINPFSLKWIRARSGNLIQGVVSDKQRQVVRDIIEDGFSQGLRAEAIVEEIGSSVGLLPRDRAAVVKRAALLQAQGFTQRRIGEMIGAFREKKLLERGRNIARTETIQAQAQGRKDSWRLADREGALPAVERVWITAPISPDPNRPCPICIDLDGKTAEINGTYESAELGEIDGPTAHPSCRCTETIRRKAA